MYKVIKRVGVGGEDSKDLFTVYDSEDNDYTDYSVKEIYEFIKQGVSIDGVTVDGEDLVITCEDACSQDAIPASILQSIQQPVRASVVEEEIVPSDIDDEEEYEEEEYEEYEEEEYEDSEYEDN